MDPLILLFTALTLLTCTVIAYVSKQVYNLLTFNRRRKAFLIKEMRHCLDTREKVYGAEIVNHCRTILHNIELYCTMDSHFKQTFTYGEFDIGVNWYPVDGRFEFTVPPVYETIARIHYPG